MSRINKLLEDLNVDLSGAALEPEQASIVDLVRWLESVNPGLLGSSNDPHYAEYLSRKEEIKNLTLDDDEYKSLVNADEHIIDETVDDSKKLNNKGSKVIIIRKKFLSR
jgi:hypothetical protein